MPHLPTSAALLLTFTLASLQSGEAEAGPLAQTARGVDNKTSSSDRKSSSSSDSNTRDHRDDDDDRDTTSTMTTASSQAICYTCDDEGTEFEFGAPNGSARIAGQKVRDSDGSFRFNAQLLFGEVGAHISVDHYFENISAKGVDGLMEEDVRMNLVDFAPVVRLYQDDAFRLELRLGLSIASSSHFDTLPGGMVGARLQALATNDVAISLEGRAMSYRDEVSAYEGVIGAEYHYVWLGYRALKFNVGPALQGPEAGLRFSF